MSPCPTNDPTIVSINYPWDEKDWKSLLPPSLRGAKERWSNYLFFFASSSVERQKQNPLASPTRLTQQRWNRTKAFLKTTTPAARSERKTPLSLAMAMVGVVPCLFRWGEVRRSCKRSLQGFCSQWNRQSIAANSLSLRRTASRAVHVCLEGILVSVARRAADSVLQKTYFLFWNTSYFQITRSRVLSDWWSRILIHMRQHHRLPRIAVFFLSLRENKFRNR